MFKKLIVGVAIFLLGMTATVDAGQKTLEPTVKQKSIVESIQKSGDYVYVGFDETDGALCLVQKTDVQLPKKMYTISEVKENGVLFKDLVIKATRTDIDLLKELVYLLDNFTGIKTIIINGNDVVYVYFEIYPSDLGL